MSTVPALHSDLGGSDLSPARISDDTWDYNQLPDQVALQLSQHSRVLIAVELNLKQGKVLSLVSILAEIVSFVNLLYGFLELVDIQLLKRVDLTRGMKSVG